MADNLIFINRGQITSYMTHHIDNLSQQTHDTKLFKVITVNNIVNDIGVQIM